MVLYTDLLRYKCISINPKDFLGHHWLNFFFCCFSNVSNANTHRHTHIKKQQQKNKNKREKKTHKSKQLGKFITPAIDPF